MAAPQDTKDGASGAATPQPASGQSLQDVLVDGQEPTEELLEEFRALGEAPPLSDEELARQALEAPGDDGDPSTPE